MIDAQARNLVLAVYPFSRGFTFVYFEGPESPLEWGVKCLKEQERSARTIEEIKKLIDRCRPEVLVVEETTEGQRRNRRINKLYMMIAHLAAAEYVDLHKVSKKQILECFAHVGAKTKQEIARAIITQIPFFTSRLPKPRKPWTEGDSRQCLFNAVALALVFYRHNAFSPL